MPSGKLIFIIFTKIQYAIYLTMNTIRNSLNLKMYHICIHIFNINLSYSDNVKVKI